MAVEPLMNEWIKILLIGIKRELYKPWISL
jgi:hypothetical protein